MVEFRDGRFVVVSKFVARELRGGQCANTFNGVGRTCPRTCGGVEWRAEQTRKIATRLES
jgi:hypothetical protein